MNLAPKKRIRLRIIYLADLWNDIYRWFRINFGFPTIDDITVIKFVEMEQCDTYDESIARNWDRLPIDIKLRIPTKYLRLGYFLSDLSPGQRKEVLTIMNYVASLPEWLAGLDRLMRQFGHCDNAHYHQLMNYLRALRISAVLLPPRYSSNKTIKQLAQYYRQSVEYHCEVEVRYLLIRIALEIAQTFENYQTIINECVSLSQAQMNKNSQSNVDNSKE